MDAGVSFKRYCSAGACYTSLRFDTLTETGDQTWHQTGVRLAWALSTAALTMNIMRERERKKKDLVEWRAGITTASQRTLTTIKYMETFLWLRFDLRSLYSLTYAD